MKHSIKWVLALVAIGTVASFSNAWTRTARAAGERVFAQETGKQQEKKPNRRAKARAEKQAAIKKALPTLKTSLAEAISLAEKETTGKAYSAMVDIQEGKPTIQVSLFVNDKFTLAHVDPETKKVMVPAKGEGGEHEEHPMGGDESGDDEDDGG